MHCQEAQPALSDDPANSLRIAKPDEINLQAGEHRAGTEVSVYVRSKERNIVEQRCKAALANAH